MNRIVILLIAACFASGLWAAEGRYRDGSPMTVEKRRGPVADPSVEARESLRSALARRKNPRFVLFWNRALTDRVNTDVSSLTTSRARISSDANSVDAWAETEHGTRVAREGSSTPLARADDWEVRGGFETWLLDSGMVLVDRNTALRQSGLNVTSDTPNLQKIEMDAIQKYADYLLTVESADGDGPAGALFRLTITEARSGSSVVAFSSIGGGPPSTHTRYEATDSGYRKVVDHAHTTVPEVGSNLAIDLAERLAAAWMR